MTVARETVIEHIRSSLEKFKGMALTTTTKEKVLNELCSLFSSYDLEMLDFRIESDTSSIRIIPQNLYTLLRLSGEDIGYFDVEGKDTYHSEAGEYTFLNGIPSFYPATQNPEY